MQFALEPSFSLVGEGHGSGRNGKRKVEIDALPGSYGLVALEPPFPQGNAGMVRAASVSGKGIEPVA
jgi:hypothetical protein